MGYQHVEIWSEHVWRDGTAPSAIASQVQSLGLGLSVHASASDINITARNEGIRKESMRQTEQCIALARDLGAGVVTVHPGRLSSSKDDPDEFWPMQIDAFSRLADVAEQCGVCVAIENMEHRDKEFIVAWEQVHRVVTDVRRPVLGITLDIAHAFTYYKSSVSDFLVELDFAKVFNVHISGSGSKTHLPLAEGEVDVHQLLSLMSGKYGGTVVVEGRRPGCEVETALRNLEWWQRSREEWCRKAN